MSVSIEMGNEEIVSPRDLSREYGRQIERLQRGEVEKLVIFKRGKIEAVMLSPERYAELTDGKS
jgi:hypothetical protein